MKKEDLFKLVEKIEEAKSNYSKLEGKKASYLETLKEQFGVSSLTEAKELLEKKDKDIDILEQTIQKGLDKLQEEYEFDFLEDE